MNVNQQQNAGVRQREGGSGDEDERNVRARQPVRTEPFVERVSLEVGNLRVVGQPNHSRRIPTNYRLVALSQLVANATGEHGTILVATVLGISATSNETQVVQRGYNGNRGQAVAFRHTRRVTIMCTLSEPGHNTGIIFHGNGHCPRLFDDLETRDNGLLSKFNETLGVVSLVSISLALSCPGPGCMVALINPPSTDRFLANGSTPVLAPSRPLLVIGSNVEIVERPIVTEGTDMNGFVLYGCQVRVSSFKVYDTPCGGDLCDQQSLVNGGVMARRCACIQMKSRVGIVVISFELIIELTNGTSFTAHFESKKYNQHYIFNGVLPPGTRAHALDDFEIEDRIYRAARDAMDYINNNAGGFRVVGWAKRGEVQDQAVDQPGNGLPHNAPRVLVQSGNLNHHITRLDPMRPQDVDLSVLEGLKVNAATLRPAEM